jgi:hypothetical protein
MRWGFILVTLYMGPIGLLLYVLADKKPRPGEHGIRDRAEGTNARHHNATDREDTNRGESQRTHRPPGPRSTDVGDGDTASAVVYASPHATDGRRRNRLSRGDHLVGASKQRRWHREAERLGGLEVPRLTWIYGSERGRRPWLDRSATPPGQRPRARATIAFFIPRRLAICIAQALSQDHLFERSIA